jgi:hypothetical protein
MTSNNPHDADPWAPMRHIDGQLVTAPTIRFRTDADGLPLGLEIEDDGDPAVPFSVPSVPGDEDDGDGDKP